jgi:hypothetical protein
MKRIEYQQILQEMSAHVMENVQNRMMMEALGRNYRNTRNEDEICMKLIRETSKEAPCNQEIDVLVESWIGEVALSQHIWKRKNQTACLPRKN